MKKVISLTLALLLCISLGIFSTFALEADGFTYIENNGKATITGYKGSDTDLKIPATLNGLDVVKIDDNAFYQNHSLNSVTIENGIEEIGEKAFYNCTGLTELTVPDSVTEIGNSAFAYCVYLQDVTLGNGITKISNNCFSNDTRIESIEIPEGVIELDDGAFESCTHLSSVSLPSTLTRIGKYAFAYTYKLSEIELPSSLKTLDEGVFYFNYALTEITFPASVKSLSNYVFYANSSLETVELNEGLITIGDMAFDGTAVKSLYIPSTVAVIGSHAFGFTYNDVTLDYDITPDFMALCVDGSYGASFCKNFKISYTLVSAKDNGPAPVETQAETQVETKAEAKTEAKTETTTATKATTKPNKNYDKGDVTLDGNVNEMDTSAIQNHIAYLKELTDNSLELADFDSNDKVNIKDITQIQISIK